MKNLLGIIVLIAIGIVAYFLLAEDAPLKQRNTEIYKDFSIEDTAAVTKIFLSQPNGKKLLLTKSDNRTWIVNNDFEARKDAVQLILKTLHDVKVYGPVPQANFKGVVKRIATSSTKVEFYTDDNKPEKTWYIGDANENRLGTYMLLEKDGKMSAKPFVTHMLMERGYLSTRFFLDPILWKERIVMKAKPQDIKSVEVIHLYDTATSFRIDKVAKDKFLMSNLNINQSNELPSSIAISYFKGFEAIFYEYIDVKTDIKQLDSIYSALPRHKVKITMADDKVIELKTYNMPVLAGSQLEGKVITYHPERMYLYSSYLGTEVHPIVQNLTFDAIVPRLEDFESSTTVEK